MESFVNEYITSKCSEELSEEFFDFERRLSPYATLRSSDLATLLRLQTALSPVNSTFDRNHNDLKDVIGCKALLSSHDLDDEHEEASGIEDGTHGNGRKNLPTFDVVCRGADTNDSPAEYTVKGLRHHEMPVMGVYVDKRICPGFRYLVRRAGSDRSVFKSPKTLLSIGMGYGKRITFSGDSLNNNDCFFWSDSEPNGYAFSIIAVDIGQKFNILDADNMVVGEALVTDIEEPQMELSSVVKDKKVAKRVAVSMNCSMKYYSQHNHGLVEMMIHEDTEIVTGVAVLTKSRSNKKASLISIEEVHFDRFGLCKFVLDV